MIALVNHNYATRILGSVSSRKTRPTPSTLPSHEDLDSNKPKKTKKKCLLTLENETSRFHITDWQISLIRKFSVSMPVDHIVMSAALAHTFRIQSSATGPSSGDSFTRAITTWRSCDNYNNLEAAGSKASKSTLVDREEFGETGPILAMRPGWTSYLTIHTHRPIPRRLTDKSRGAMQYYSKLNKIKNVYEKTHAEEDLERNLEEVKKLSEKELARACRAYVCYDPSRGITLVDSDYNCLFISFSQLNMVPHAPARYPALESQWTFMQEAREGVRLPSLSDFPAWNVSNDDQHYVKIESEGMNIILGDSHFTAFANLSALKPLHPYLIHQAIAHSLCVSQREHGDVYTISKFETSYYSHFPEGLNEDGSQRYGVRSSTEPTEGPACCVGPTDALKEQNDIFFTCIACPSHLPNDYPPHPIVLTKFVVCLTKDSAIFVSEAGKCIYTRRSDLTSHYYTQIEDNVRKAIV